MKKSKIFIFAVVVTSLALSAPPSLAALNQQITHQIQYSGTPVIGTDTLGGVIYSTVRYGDLYNGGEPGMPSLPIEYFKFSVPYNATNFTVTAAMIGWSNQNLNHMLYPCQRPMLIDGSDTLTITLPDSAAYYSGEYYPSQRARVVDEGFLAGENHIVTVALMPFRYKHTSTADILSKVSRCIVTLRYELSDSLAMYPIIRRDSLLREEGYELTQTMVVNPNKVKDFAPSETFAHGIDSIGFIQGFTGDLINGGLLDPTPIDSGDLGEEELLIDGGNYTYLIVTTSELKHAVRRIAALKRQKGYNVKIVTINEVLSSPLSGSGDVVGEGYNALLTYTDNAGKLRQYLRNHYYYYGTKYVLLVGDSIPYREVGYYHPCGKFYPDIPTDLYLSELNQDWSIPINARKFDVSPELYVGRLLASDSQQILNYSTKLFRYELNPGMGNTSYLKRIFYSEAIDMQEHDGSFSDVELVHSYYRNIFNDSTHFKESKINHFPSGTDIINKLNKRQFGYLSLMHHAGPSGFITYGRWGDGDDSDVYYYLWSVDSIHKIYGNYNYNLDPHTENGFNRLMNKTYPNIAYSIGCSTMSYNVVPGYEDVTINIGKSFTIGKDYGGPAFLGNTRDGATVNLSARLEAYFASNISNGKFKIGEAESYSKLDYGSLNLYFLFIHNLLGEPEFEIWTDEPVKLTNILVERFNDHINISGICTDSTIVAYMTADKLYKTQIADSSITLLDASPNSPIMLFKHNQIPYIAPLKLQNCPINHSQYMIASDVMIGNSVDGNRTNGDVIVENGVEFEIEASGTVTLEDGFKVEKEATFAVYPSCF